jgi:hypothetical protein
MTVVLLYTTLTSRGGKRCALRRRSPKCCPATNVKFADERPKPKSDPTCRPPNVQPMPTEKCARGGNGAQP